MSFLRTRAAADIGTLNPELSPEKVSELEPNLGGGGLVNAAFSSDVIKWSFTAIKFDEPQNEMAPQTHLILGLGKVHLLAT